jgi:hypothetical protein
VRDSVAICYVAAALGLTCGSQPQLGGAGAYSFALDTVADATGGADRIDGADDPTDVAADATPVHDTRASDDAHVTDLADVASRATDAGTDTSNPGQPVATCKQSCSNAANCVPPNAPAWSDADNYACDKGLCRYLGCKDDKECAATAVNLTCAEIAPGMKACQTACTAAKDCAQDGAPEYVDADNYACLNGICKYTGCNGDAECKSIGNYVCRDQGAGIKTCVAACAEAKECAVANAPASADADNYTCADGLCKYAGCNGDAECAGVGWPGTAWVCKP